MLKKIVAVVGLAVALNGCSTGVNVSSTQMASFTDKQSTKDDVINALGQPESRSVEADKNEEWTYGYTFNPGIPFTSKKSLNKTTVFEFDDHGVLAKHYVRTWYTD
jgi:outer membrane protein assembly factor BamE (lipoprotein component of BamABCDE complex)